jgi:ABC-type branched-subunit amino acid transport system ATPase component
LLSVENLDAFYGPVQILHDINLAVDAVRSLRWWVPMPPGRAR